MHHIGCLDFPMLDTNAQPTLEIEQPIVGGLKLARLDLEQTARLMIEWGRAPQRRLRPLTLTSANSEVLARYRFDPNFAKLIDEADLVSADGQPLVLASKLLSKNGALPERVATTDLFPIVARMAQEAGVSFYLFGGREDINVAAFEATKQNFPDLDIRGRSHGYLRGTALDSKLDEINALAPDILWLSLGVPLEHEFAKLFADRLPNVKMIKTSGGLFDFVSGGKKRAPLWIQKIGLEWAFRIYLEPRRLLFRYLKANPIALYLLLTKTK